MNENRTQIVRLVGSVLVLLASTVFVQVYNSIQMNIFQHGLRFDPSVLPGLCHLVLKIPVTGYVLSGLVLGLGLYAILVPKKKNLLVEICIQIAFLCSVAFVLSCLVAWWLPHTYGVGEVRVK